MVKIKFFQYDGSMLGIEWDYQGEWRHRSDYVAVYKGECSKVMQNAIEPGGYVNYYWCRVKQKKIRTGIKYDPKEQYRAAFVKSDKGKWCIQQLFLLAPPETTQQGSTSGRFCNELQLEEYLRNNPREPNNDYLDLYPLHDVEMPNEGNISGGRMTADCYFQKMMQLTFQYMNSKYRGEPLRVRFRNMVNDLQQFFRRMLSRLHQFNPLSEGFGQRVRNVIGSIVDMFDSLKDRALSSETYTNLFSNLFSYLCNVTYSVACCLKAVIRNIQNCCTSFLNRLADLFDACIDKIKSIRSTLFSKKKDVSYFPSIDDAFGLMPQGGVQEIELTFGPTLEGLFQNWNIWENQEAVPIV